MSLVSCLEKNRISLNEVDPTGIDLSSDFSNVRGQVAEHMVHQWLQRCNVQFDTVPRTFGKYTLDAQLNVKKGHRTEHEFDFLCAFDSTHYLIEVKSGKLRGYDSKVARALNFGQQLYSTNVQLLLFSSFTNNKAKDRMHLENKYPEVKCIDLGYKKKQFNNYINSLFLGRR